MSGRSPEPLALLYGGGPVLIHEGTPLRDAIGPLLARAETADFAVARLRLAAVDLSARELGGLSRCRVLVEHVDAITSGEPLGASREAVRSRLDLLLAFLESGRVEVRVGAGRCWAPDFSILHNVHRRDGRVILALTALGAHFFSRPYPISGPALTHLCTDDAATRVADRAFTDLWTAGYDVAFVVAARLRRLLAAAETSAALAEDPRAGDAAGIALLSPLGATTVVRERPAAHRVALTHGGSPRSESPAVAARRALDLRFGATEEAEGTRARVFDLAEFQRDAVARAQKALARHGGVLLADGVGLGKTFLGLALAEAELARGGRVAVVAPAALRKDWVGPLRLLAREHRTTVEQGEADGDGPPARLAWLSHTRLSHRTARLPAPSLVVVDEAHGFRNPHTRRYRALALLCRGARVVLLSATPVNNQLLDLYFQLRLFASDGAFAGVGVPALGEAFRSAAEASNVAPILPVLREVVIRRTRPFLRDHYGAVTVPGTVTPLRFPRRAAPQPVRYALGETFPGGLPAIAKLLGDLTLAPYRLRAYLGDGALQDNAAELLRFSLLKRLESSEAAFRQSVAALADVYAGFLEALAEDRLLRPRDRSLVESDQLMLAAVALDPLPKRLDRARLAADASRDLATLRELSRGDTPAREPKIERLREVVDSLGEKVVVFTEFRETARQIAAALGDHRVGLVHGGGAWLGGSPIGRRELIGHFAPRANAAPPPPPSRRVDVLVATDVLAEGLNLQDARCVISYDLPWNPVRLMQRIGRVDRLGSEHEEVRPFHFVPERGLDELLGLVRRIRHKLAVIRRTVPGDAEVLDRGGGDETVLARILAGDPGAMDEAERAEAAPFEAPDRLRRLAAALRDHDPATDDAPIAATLELEGISGDLVLLCYAGVSVVWLVWRRGEELATDDDVAAAELIAGAVACQVRSPVDGPILALADAAARRTLARRARPTAIAARGTVARASRRLLRAMSASRHCPDPAVCARADLLLERLGRGLDAGEEFAVKAALAPGHAGAAQLVQLLEQALLPGAGGGAGAPQGGGISNGSPAVGEGDPWGLRWRLAVAIHARPVRA